MSQLAGLETILTIFILCQGPNPKQRIILHKMTVKSKSARVNAQLLILISAKMPIFIVILHFIQGHSNHHIQSQYFLLDAIILVLGAS